MFKWDTFWDVVENIVLALPAVLLLFLIISVKSCNSQQDAISKLQKDAESCVVGYLPKRNSYYSIPKNMEIVGVCGRYSPNSFTVRDAEGNYFQVELKTRKVERIEKVDIEIGSSK